MPARAVRIRKEPAPAALARPVRTEPRRKSGVQPVLRQQLIRQVGKPRARDRLACMGGKKHMRLAGRPARFENLAQQGDQLCRKRLVTVGEVKQMVFKIDLLPCQQGDLRIL